MNGSLAIASLARLMSTSFSGVGRQVVGLDVVGRDTQELGLWDAEVFVEVGGVAAADLQRAVDVEIAVRVAVGEDVDGQLMAVGKAADEPPAGPAGHAPPMLTRIQCWLW